MLESWHDPPSTESTPRVNRRALLVSGAAVLAATGVGTEPVAAGEGGADQLFAPGPGTTVVLQDHRLALPDGLRARLTASGAQLLTLEADPVRMWRGEHAPLLTRADTRLLGVTPWIEFVMIQGLAAESRRRVRYQRFDNGNDAMVWLIA